MTNITTILNHIPDETLRGKVADLWGQGNYIPMAADDPAQAYMTGGHFSVPTVADPGCYICQDPEYAQMGMSLCMACPQCGNHIPADEGPYCPRSACGWEGI